MCSGASRRGGAAARTAAGADLGLGAAARARRRDEAEHGDLLEDRVNHLQHLVLLVHAQVAPRQARNAANCKNILRDKPAC